MSSHHVYGSISNIGRGSPSTIPTNDLQKKKVGQNQSWETGEPFIDSIALVSLPRIVFSPVGTSLAWIIGPSWSPLAWSCLNNCRRCEPPGWLAFLLSCVLLGESTSLIGAWALRVEFPMGTLFPENSTEVLLPLPDKLIGDPRATVDFWGNPCWNSLEIEGLNSKFVPICWGTKERKERFVWQVSNELLVEAR